jgi:hypothetical protein
VTSSSRFAWASLAVSVVAAVAAWVLGDAMYRRGQQLSGWAVGFVGVCLPWVALRSCQLWLRERRIRGDTAARVSWLSAVSTVALFGWVGFFAFSVLLAHSQTPVPYVLAGFVALAPIAFSAIQRRFSAGGAA